MNDTVFDQRITAAFAVLPPADVYLKNRLLHLPEERAAKPAPRFHLGRRWIPVTAVLTAVAVLVGVFVLRNGTTNPPNPELPLIPYGSIIGEGGMGFEAHMNKNAAELHRDSPAYGREGEIGTMPVYSNPQVRSSSDSPDGRTLDKTAAIEIAEKFGNAVGKVYVYETPYWENPEEVERIREQMWDKHDFLPPEERQAAVDEVMEQQFGDQGTWEFKYGGETLTINAWGGVSIVTPLPELPHARITDRAQYEAVCRHIYETYAAAIDALTGLRFNKISTFTSYNIYADITYDTFFYVNNPGDSLAKQAEDYAFKRLDVSIPFANEAEIAEGYDEELSAYLSFSLHYPGEMELLGNYPVMDLKSAKRELLAGKYESSVSATEEELACATVEKAELIYSNRPWLSTFLPMYRLYLSFAPGDMQDWNNNNPYLEELGLRNYYVFYVPAVPTEYLAPQQENSNAHRPAG